MQNAPSYPLQVRISQQLRQRLEQEAKLRGIRPSDLIRQALDETCGLIRDPVEK